jgi:hypothetical protein
MSSIIDQVLALIGITQPPQTIQEFFWDLIIIIAGVIIIKAILAFVFGFFKEVAKF